MLLQGIYKQLLQSAAVSALLASPAAGSIAINAATKQQSALSSYLVLNLVSGLPAETTLDGISDLIDGEFQFDSYASKSGMPDPQTARNLSNAVRDYLLKTFVSGALPDGSTIQFVAVPMDHDEPYELGGSGYSARTLLRVKAFYTEAGTVQ
jgi:hypothetical protein